MINFHKYLFEHKGYKVFIYNYCAYFKFTTRRFIDSYNQIKY